MWLMFVMKVSDILVINIDKVFNKTTVILNQSITNWRFIIQFKYTIKEELQSFKGLLVCQSCLYQA